MPLNRANGETMPDAGILATVLLVMGLFLLGLEFFLPSFGMIGITSLLCMVISFWCAWKAWGGGVNPAFFWTYVIFLCAGIPGTIVGSIYAIQHTGLGKVVVLQPPTPSSGSKQLNDVIGKTGLTVTLLTPGGMVTIDGERFHAESHGMLIDPGTPVIVTSTTANRVIVRPLTTTEQTITPIRPPETISTGSGAGTETSDAELAAADTAAAGPASPDDPRRSVSPRKNASTGAVADAGPDVRTLGPPGADELDFDIPDDYTG